MSDSDTNHFLNMLRGEPDGFQSDALPGTSDTDTTRTGDVQVKVDSDMLCISGLYMLEALPLQFRSASPSQPSASLSLLLNRIFSRFDGPSTNGLQASDLLVKTTASPAIESTAHPADYLMQGYMDKILSGTAGSRWVHLRQITSEEQELAGGSGEWRLAMWLHVNTKKAAIANRPGLSPEGDLEVNGGGVGEEGDNSIPAGLASFAAAAVPFHRDTPTSGQKMGTQPGSFPKAIPLPSFTPLPSGTIAAAAARSLAAQNGTPLPTSTSASTTNDSSLFDLKFTAPPPVKDDAEIGKAFGERYGMGTLWGKIGLGRRKAVEVLTIVAPAIQIMREMNKQCFQFEGVEIKLTKKLMILGLGIADKSFSPMETGFRRAQFLLNVVAEQDLGEARPALAIIGDVFTDPQAPTTMDELYTQVESAQRAVRTAANQKGLTNLADVIQNDWAMGRNTWKRTEPHPSYIVDWNTSLPLASQHNETHDLQVGGPSNGENNDVGVVGDGGVGLGGGGGGGGSDEGEQETAGTGAEELDLGGDLPVDPELMRDSASGTAGVAARNRKRTGSGLEADGTKRRS